MSAPGIDTESRPPAMSTGLLLLVVASVLALFGASPLVRQWLGVGRSSMEFSDVRLLGTIAFESVLVVAWGPLLWRRGWRAIAVTHPLAPSDALRGFGLAVGAYAGYAMGYLTMLLVAPALARQAASITASGTPSWTVIIVVVMINPLFEEFFYLGIVANALRERRPAIVLAVVVGLRVALHLYEGPLAVMGILPVGVLWSLYYLRTRRLWPVVAAHAILDALALGLLTLDPKLLQ
ncbi:MAG: type II CAAX endopeptidase family protein [Gemmatimonadaceae bacterium]